MRASLLNHLRTPLYRNGYALAASNALCSVIGATYWLVAARCYPAEAVGLNSAAISAMLFIAGVAQLDLVMVLTRFVPAAGRVTGRLIVAAHVVVAGVGAAATIIMLTEIQILAPGLTFLTSDSRLAAGFVVGTVLWTVFVLQDGALTGLRHATWVPLKNVGYALIKLVLLASLAAAFPAYGVLASWTIPLVFAIVPSSVLIFSWLLPRRTGALDPPATYVSPPHLARFVGGDYLGTLAWLACTTLLPIIVVQECGPRLTAYFFLAWQIATALHNVAPDIGAALVAEAAADQEKLSTYSYRATLHICRLVVPLALVVAVGARPILSVFGADYADEGTDLLRLLALSAIPNVITAAFVSVARVERRMRAMLAVLLAFAATVLGLAYILLPVYGITGVGIAWLVAQVLFASGVFVWQLRPRWRIRSAVSELSA